MIWKKRWPHWLFWAFICLCLLWGFPQILLDPTRPAAVERSPVVINEFLAVGIVEESSLDASDGDQQTGGWIELYNRSKRAVSLANWTLTDQPDRPDKWRFPDVTIDAGSYVVLFPENSALMPDEDASTESGIPMLETRIRLYADGGFLALYPPSTRLYLDSFPITYPTQFGGTSFGRTRHQNSQDDKPNGETNGAAAYGYLQTPTRGTQNESQVAWQGMTSPVVFSRERGFYQQPFILELETETPSAQIRYTVDGSMPTATTGHLYEEPIAVETTTILRAAFYKEGFLTAPIETHSYIFVRDVLTQPSRPSGWPETWGQHEINFGGYQAGAPRLADYEMDPEIVHHSIYGPKLEAGMREIPSLSLVVEPEHLDIYAAPRMRGPESERPVSVEFFPVESRHVGFRIDAGLRIQGGAGRWEFMPKHSFRLFFKRQYGAGKLRYQIFPDSPAQEFDTVVLRAGVDRGFAGHPPAPDAEVDHREATYTRDEWMRASQIAMSGIGSHGIFVHLYLNGLYWGLYNLVERPDTSFMTTYFDGTREDWYSANHGGTVEGRIDRFDVLIRLATEGGLDDPARYATMLEFIDPVQFSDYVLLNWYAGNRDWPMNNWYVNVRFPAGRNYFFVWDAEDTWNQGAVVHLDSKTFGDEPFPNVTQLVFNALIENADFRMVFADRAYLHLVNGGTLTHRQAQARWRMINQELENAIVAESARWGDVRYEEPVTQDDWSQARERVMDQMNGNGQRLLDQMRAAGYYPQLDPPEWFVSGKPVEFTPDDFIDIQSGSQGPYLQFRGELELTMKSAIGTIYYTLDGSDPRASVADNMAAGELVGRTMLYNGPIILTDATVVKARVFEESTGRWSALRLATFYKPNQSADVRFTEIMYNPLGGELYEFVEIQNLGALTADLSGAYFEGIKFRFPRYTLLKPGTQMTIIRDFKTFRDRYPTAEIHGIYQGRLSDQGETLALRMATGQLIDSVTYNDANGWPLSADGVGDSLVLINPHGRADQPHNWQASLHIHGSPSGDMDFGTD
ncbi:lamin tail domain-containing protein [Chloroflexi bacterium TSY]|nr:lamin tail domain-containing protein [Chloroflexi bacterium TSY]